ncbi:centromere-associated protein E isoform X4 [Notolabrus celidotus]|uniref:centromere-associated protein E isoform X4 n=1 Tax=Notolabrus celidotus TaxID=1203425 RepID=UPI00148FB614|nr:centromere-associated protein E isoform X4 [Notolabrus celidotus]
MTEESAVKVAVRVRPLIEREESAALEKAEPVHLFWKADKKSIHQVDDVNSTKSFSFDRVFTADETTNQLYLNIAKPLVVSTVEGYNGTIFAYGQTSSGKTFTMMGSSRAPGVIPLAVEDVFHTIKNCPKKEFLLRVSYMEIYNETVTDLLVNEEKRKPLEVREAINKNIYVADLTEELVTNPSQALAWIRKGEKNRHYGKTKMNQRSSRSHTIFRMILESRERSDPASGENADGAIIVSHLNLVDLAGSERASQTGAEGARFKEGCNINRSLFTLAQVIKKLTDEGQGFTNYRDSKLTRILQNSLGGNAKTVIICTITPVTLDETLSTLQFASTAKKMKNDPHVTEVSDDGALLKRYRNQIVDLERRLQEVSSVTQTTATEKEVLSQLLQEKDQLQREQEDRIKNLTKLLVTSSNQFPVPKMPKRRVTWGGKMLRLAHTSESEGGVSELSFAEPFARKRKADRSCLSELCEDDEDFQWEISEEPLNDMDMSQSSVTVRSFGESPKDCVSQNQMRELSGKVSNLEQQLQVETQQKDEAVMKVEMLDSRVSELEQQLEMETQQKDESAMKVETSDSRVSELEQQLQAETQQKQEAVEKVEMLEFRVSELEKHLEEQSHSQSGSDEQMKREFAETVQLCEHLASEKDMMAEERDYLKRELGMFLEQIEGMEKEKSALSKELQDTRETEEFKSLEEEFRKELEDELQNEISGLKSAVEASELQCRELQNKLESQSVELRRKSEFVEELQSMSGKDLVQEVEKLRRSLDDAEGVSRDTKKEWAHLRSRNIALEESNVTLTTSHDRMKAEVDGLHYQLETEKSRNKKMQSDLQKELNVAFDENTKLTTLLDGKVPKNLIDSVELERTVSNLNKELTASRETEETLKAQLEELASLQTLPQQVDSLMQQVCELTEELCATQTHRDSLISAQTQSQEEAQQLRDSLQTSQEEILNTQAELSAAALREEQLREQMESLRSELESSEAERGRLDTAVEEKHSELTESEEQRASLTERVEELQQLLKDLEEKLADSEVSRSTEEEISKELQEQLNQLTEELQSVRAEKDALLCAGAQSSSEETEKLLCTVTSLTAEREELQKDLQRHEETAAETQGLLQSLQNELQEQKSDLEKHFEQKVQSLSEELQCVQEERETLQTGAQSSAEETEKLQSTVSSLTAERDQLRTDMQENVEMMIENQEELRTALDKNNEQKELIKRLKAAQTSTHDAAQPETSAQLEELQTQVSTLTEQLQSVLSEKAALLSEKETSFQSLSEEVEQLQRRVTSLSEDRDQLQETLEAVRQEKQQLTQDMEDRMEMVALAHSELNQPEALNVELQGHDERVSQLQQETEQLQVALQAVSEQKSRLEEDLLQNKEMAAVTQGLLHSLQQQLQEQNERNVEMERLSQERQTQLEQQVVETESRLRSAEEELQQQKQRHSDNMEVCEQQKESGSEQQVKSLSELLQVAHSERDTLLMEKETSCQGLSEEVEKLQHRVTSLSEDRDQLQETLEAVRQEKQQQLTQDMEERIVMIQQLEEHLQKTQEEVSQLKADLQENVELMIENQEELRVSQEKVRVLQEEISALRSEKAELDTKPSAETDGETTLQIQELQNQLQSLTEQLQTAEAERDGLLSERTTHSQTLSEEVEKLQHRVTSLSEDRDQLQETLEAVRQEKQQLTQDMEDRVDTLQAEVAQLNMTLQTLSEQKRSVEDELQQNMNRAACTEELLTSVQEELQELKQINTNLEREHQEKESTLDQQMKTLTEELQTAEAERDGLLSERTTHSQTVVEEVEQLQHRVKSLSEDRDQLQETLEAVRQEKQQLTQDMEDRVDTLQAEVRTLTEELQRVRSESDALLLKETEKQQLTQDTEDRVDTLQAEISSLQEKLSEKEGERGERKMELHHQMQQLKEKLQVSREKQTHAMAEADTSQQLLGEANKTISSLKEQLSSLDQSSSRVKESAESRLQESTDQLQEYFQKFQHFFDMCSKYNSEALNKTLTMECSPTSLPQRTMSTYKAVCEQGQQAVQILGKFSDHLQARAQGYRTLFEELVQKDLDVYEERRLQDLLLCRAQAPSFSVKDEDFDSMWEQRLTALLDKRNLYLQKMTGILEKLWANMKCYSSELATEIRERERFKEQLQVHFSKMPISFSGLDGILSRELDHRSALARSRKTTLQGMVDEHNAVHEEMKPLQARTHSRLSDERSRRSTLLQPLEGAPLKTELTLLRDNQQLALQLQQTEDRVKALCAEREQLEEAQHKANSRVSNHKEATQLLQTELQDSRAQVEEKENAIQTLRSKLRESERNASPSAAELEKLRSKLFKMEVELSSVSDKHQKEIQKMTALLNEKEESLRKLKETLRKSQQQGEESFLQGEDLHARLTNPKGLLIKSSVLQEKTKLEEDIKKLQMKISELESLVSSQQAEISKWRSRAIKLKAKNKGDMDKPSPPCTPTKRGLPVTSDSSTVYSSPKKFLAAPRKVLDSPRKVLDSPRNVLGSPRKVLDSPKSKFFDVGGSSDILSRSCPKQFFDNSSLGACPEVYNVPDSPAAEEGEGASADRREEWWPKSPKQEDMCPTQ